MISCFKEILTQPQQNAMKKTFIQSFVTASCGIILSVSDDGSSICASKTRASDF